MYQEHNQAGLCTDMPPKMHIIVLKSPVIKVAVLSSSHNKFLGRNFSQSRVNHTEQGWRETRSNRGGLSLLWRCVKLPSAASCLDLERRESKGSFWGLFLRLYAVCEKQEQLRSVAMLNVDKNFHFYLSASKIVVGSKTFTFFNFWYARRKKGF